MHYKYMFSFYNYKNKTNYPISSNSYPSATVNKAINTLPQMRGFSEPTGTSYNFRKCEAVLPTDILEIYSLSQMLIIVIEVQKTTILLAYLHILSLKGPKVWTKN